MSDTTDGVVAFDYKAWLERFPEFNGRVTEAQATELFTEACMVLNNTSTSVVTDLTQRGSLLGLLVAHMAQLQAMAAAVGAGGGGSPLVGPVQSVTQGSISVSVQPLAGGSAGADQAWLSQTQYGARFYFLTSRYRTMRYVPGPLPVFAYNGQLFPTRWP